MLRNKGIVARARAPVYVDQAVKPGFICAITSALKFFQYRT